MDESTVRAFMGLFRGRTDAWGSVEGKANKEKVTKKHYERHLKGETSLGIYMLRDDNTCYFFAIDLDEKDIDKALKLRQAFAEFNINSYLAFSKSKGFHCYVFADENDPFTAYNVRRLCHGILAKLDIQAEVFPKQDELDEQIPLGNYINLPCFGSSRMFFTASKVAVLVDEAVKSIQRVPKSRIEAAIKTLPAPPKPRIITSKKGGKSREGKEPLCVEKMKKGVSAGSRDMAAFALARYYLDRNYLEQEVFSLLQQWDENNRPPLNDPHLLQTKVSSAAKGYSFGCSSIIKEPLLSPYCVGQEVCAWLKDLNEKKKKQGLLREQSFCETATHLFEEIVQDGKPMFVAFEKSTGNINFVPAIEYPELTIVPIWSAEITEGAVTLPTGIEEYSSTIDLKNEVRDLIFKYVDLLPIDLEFSAWYILLTWIYDRLNTISYLRFLGDTGVGKSRALDVIGRLCYKPLMMAGVVTPAPIYRLIRRFRGTVILEEADFRDTSEKGEVITILNCGFERNRPVIRCNRDNPDNLEILPCYGPKIFATRNTFNDVALEARCTTFTMEETDREDIPALLGSTFIFNMAKLRNKLLLWRLRNWQLINSDSVEEIDLGPEYLEPRLRQIGLPFAVPFKDIPEVMEEFRRFMQERQQNIRYERGESENGKVILALFKMAQVHGCDYITSTVISQCLADDFKIDKSPTAIGKILKSFKIQTTNRKFPGLDRARYINWDNKQMRKFLRRYVTDPQDFEGLFKEIDMDV